MFKIFQTSILTDYFYILESLNYKIIYSYKHIFKRFKTFIQFIKKQY